MDNTKQPSLTCVSIGPGIRGIERGIERVVRLDHLLYVEIEAFIIENLVAEMEAGLLDPVAIWSDAKTMPCEPFRGLVDLLLAGYPCQPFSSAGKRRGAEDPRHLYPYIERTIRIIRPRICFFENVRGHVTCGLPEVIESLEGLGYRVRWGIFSAEETGASHKRERVFILAVVNSESSRIWRRLGNIHQAYGGPDRELPFIINGAGEMANSNSERLGEERQRENGTDQSSEQLANAKSISEREQDNKASAEPWEDSRESIGRRGDAMGNPNDSRLQRRISGEREECPGERFTGPNGPFGPVSRPGEPQQAWEHPRVISREIESTVGLSAHGYHFREDILRALGNSVYADAAELAFRTLMLKMSQ